MKITALTILIFSICIYIRIDVASCKSLKSYYGNSINHYKGQRKPLASPVGNGIHDSNNFKRAKRQIPPSAINYQQILNNAKVECVREMNMNPKVLDKSIMYEEHPTAEEKCLMMCMLKKTKLMEDSNKLSIKTIGRIADAVSDNNPLVVSIAQAKANECNALIKTQEPCEAAYYINKCIGTELKAHKLKLFY